MRRFRIGQGEVLLLGTVQGLVAEGSRALRHIETEQPDIIALGVSPESVASLIRYEHVEGEDLIEDLPDHDYIYSIKLREFGDVELPAPDLLGAVRWAQERDVPLLGIDLAEEAYEDLFTKEVSTFGFLRYGRIQKKLAKRPPRATDALAFTLAWDAAIRKVKGIRSVEAHRERTIAQHAATLARDKAAKVLVLVEAAREPGIAEQLTTLA